MINRAQSQSGVVLVSGSRLTARKRRLAQMNDFLIPYLTQMTLNTHPFLAIPINPENSRALDIL